MNSTLLCVFPSRYFSLWRNRFTLIFFVFFSFFMCASAKRLVRCFVIRKNCKTTCQVQITDFKKPWTQDSIQLLMINDFHSFLVLNTPCHSDSFNKRNNASLKWKIPILPASADVTDVLSKEYHHKNVDNVSLRLSDNVECRTRSCRGRQLYISFVVWQTEIQLEEPHSISHRLTTGYIFPL